MNDCKYTFMYKYAHLLFLNIEHVFLKHTNPAGCGGTPLILVLG